MCAVNGCSWGWGWGAWRRDCGRMRGGGGAGTCAFARAILPALMGLFLSATVIPLMT